MFMRTFRKAAHTRRFTIHHSDDFGWEVRDEQNHHVLRCVRTEDWHRVERAYLRFAFEAAALMQSGWSEVHLPEASFRARRRLQLKSNVTGRSPDASQAADARRNAPAAAASTSWNRRRERRD